MAVGHPQDFSFGYKVDPLNAATASASPAKDAHDMEAGLALQRLAREVDETELQTHASIFASSGTIVTKLIDKVGQLTLETGALALKAVESFDVNAQLIQKQVDEQDAALVKAGVIQRPANVAEAEWQRQLAEVRAQVEKITDPIKRRIVYSNALERNDLITIAALESGGSVFNPETNAFLPLLNEDESMGLTARVAEKQLARGRDAYPEAAKDRNKNARLASTYRQASAAVKGEVLKRVPALVPQSLIGV